MPQLVNTVWQESEDCPERDPRQPDSPTRWPPHV